MESKICFLIDDDDDDREIFESALYSIDQYMCCITATSGLDGLQKLIKQENFVPDYIFIDLHMPCVDGKECLAEIKKMQRLKDTPVIMYSTSMAPEDIEETRKLGATAYISKPYTIQNLEKSLQTFFASYSQKSMSL